MIINIATLLKSGPAAGYNKWVTAIKYRYFFCQVSFVFM